MANGVVREYRYPAFNPARAPRYSADSIAALSSAWRISPEWAAFAPRTREWYAKYLRDLELIAHVPVADITRRDVLAIRDAIATTRGTAAANAFSSTAQAALSWAVEREWIPSNPCLRLKKLAGGAWPAWTEEQAATALRMLPEHYRRVIVLALHTGQRRGDLCALAWSAYDGARIRVAQQKTGVALVIPCSPELRAELDAWKKAATSTRILTTARGLPWAPDGLSIRLRRALTRIGLPGGINVHGLRKLAATRLAEAGCSANEIGAITGHKTLAMVQLYTASADQERMAEGAVVRLTDFNRKKDAG